jgi:hypothetical protein
LHTSFSTITIDLSESRVIGQIYNVVRHVTLEMEAIIFQRERHFIGRCGITGRSRARESGASIADAAHDQVMTVVYRIVHTITAHSGAVLTHVP